MALEPEDDLTRVLRQVQALKQHEAADQDVPVLDQPYQGVPPALPVMTPELAAGMLMSLQPALQLMVKEMVRQAVLEAQSAAPALATSSQTQAGDTQPSSER
ncbi:hypothetical protein [Methylobacillus flagellatus]|uniref:hypothetical protein n=1 Tax=Methylobacillus flagellatus TaxID=405 RepID=UPI0010F615D8|nr:hypothetical protein [Methylobacillus flagellatus]